MQVYDISQELFGSVVFPGNPVPAHRALKRILDMKGERYDAVYNGHHDFRRLGEPLDDDVLPNAVLAMEQLMDGTAKTEVLPSGIPGRPDRHVVRIRTTMVTYNPDGIFD